MALVAYTKTGTKSSTKPTLPKKVFGAKDVSEAMLKQVYMAETRNARVPVADTKNRSAVRGGGRKPWRQKGTGRARAGTIRSPLWRGGGIVFGPSSNRNFTQKINKSMRGKALAQSLTLAASNSRIAIVEDIPVPGGKTKDVFKLLDKIGFSRGLIVVDQLTPALRRAIDNIASVSVVEAGRLSTSDVLNAYGLLITKKALAALEQRVEASS